LKNIVKWKNQDNSIYVTGEVYYLDTTYGNNSNNGLSKYTAFLTQSYAESIMDNGDVLLDANVGSGEYPKAYFNNYLSYMLHDTIINSTNANIDIQTSRVSGIAPLSVFFDATGTTGLYDTNFFAVDNESANAAYMDATFYWNFDTTNVDATIDHKYGSGFVAACVFKEPGVYIVQLRVYDATGYIGYKNVTITVSSFSGTTYYCASNGDNGNAGDIDHPWLTVSYALSQAQNNTRILFRNGDTFNTAYIELTSSATPVIVGGYSDPNSPSSTKPLIYSTESNGAYSTMDLTVSDWRIMDIAVRSGGHTYASPRYPSGINFYGTATNNLKYRTTEYELGQSALGVSGTYTTAAECECYNYYLGAYSSGTNITNTGNAVIGNSVHDQIGGEVGPHVFRLQGGTRFYIAHNIFGPDLSSVGWDGLTIRGNTEKVIVYNNTFYGHVQAFRPQNYNSAEEYVHHCIMDSNTFIGVDGFRMTAIQINAKDIVCRNNIIYDYQFLYSVANDTVVGPASRLKFYNNTYINGRSNDYLYVFTFDTACLNIDIKNEIMLDLNSSNQVHFIDIENGTTLDCESNHNRFYGSSWGASPNLFDGNTLATWRTNTGNDADSSIANPNLVSTDPVNVNFGKLQASIIGEAVLQNALDYYGNIRGSSIDIGACEYI
jgi:hypothetical protein